MDAPGPSCAPFRQGRKPVEITCELSSHFEAAFHLVFVIAVTMCCRNRESPGLTAFSVTAEPDVQWSGLL